MKEDVTRMRGVSSVVSFHISPFRYACDIVANLTLKKVKKLK